MYSVSLFGRSERSYFRSSSVGVACNASAAVDAFGMLKLNCECRESFGQLSVSLCILSVSVVKLFHHRGAEISQRHGEKLRFRQRSQTATEDYFDGKLAAFIDRTLHSFFGRRSLVSKIGERRNRVVAHCIR